MSEIKNSQRLFEICAVALTGSFKYILVDLLPFKFWYIAGASIFWISYALFRSAKNIEILPYWGFTKKSFTQTFRTLLPFSILCVLVFLIFGITQKTLILNWHILPILLLYPVWGIIQQFLIVGLIAGNLNDLNGFNVPKFFVVILTSIIFAVVHFPSMYLVAGTFILAIIYTLIYLKYKNIWALGLYHGWLGALFYFFVLQRDPWNEVFSTL